MAKWSFLFNWSNKRCAAVTLQSKYNNFDRDPKTELNSIYITSKPKINWKPWSMRYNIRTSNSVYMNRSMQNMWISVRKKSFITLNCAIFRTQPNGDSHKVAAWNVSKAKINWTNSTLSTVEVCEGEGKWGQSESISEECYLKKKKQCQTSHLGKSFRIADKRCCQNCRNIVSKQLDIRYDLYAMILNWR